ncbi:MAG: hypothetical protein WEA81_05315, partial [Dehalococcoidia bacterium]
SPVWVSNSTIMAVERCCYPEQSTQPPDARLVTIDVSLGTATPITTLSQLDLVGIGTIGGAVLFDITGSYAIPYTAYAVGFVIAALLVWLFGRASVAHSHRSKASWPEPR